MSKPSARTKVPPDYVTRKQQVRAVRDIKTQEVAKAVAERIKSAVVSEVESQLKIIKDTMLNLIDRVVELELRNESNSADRQEGAEASKVSDDVDVAPEPLIEGPTAGRKDPAAKDVGRRLWSKRSRDGLPY